MESCLKLRKSQSSEDMKVICELKFTRRVPLGFSYRVITNSSSEMPDKKSFIISHFLVVY